jgi:hypothetical protein
MPVGGVGEVDVPTVVHAGQCGAHGVEQSVGAVFVHAHPRDGTVELAGLTLDEQAERTGATGALVHGDAEEAESQQDDSRSPGAT